MSKEGVMDVFLFGCQERSRSRAMVHRIDAIARKHAVDYFCAEGREWFSSRSRGEPYDRYLAAAVRADVVLAEEREYETLRAIRRRVCRVAS